MAINRIISDIVTKKLFQGKAIILIGARQVGKTTLLKELFSGKENVLWLNGDDLETRTLMENITVERYRSMLGGIRILIIDEAQRITDIGLKCKLVTDNFPDIQLIVTGSSSLDLANKVNEPLTGRKWEYRLFPLSYSELATHFGALQEWKKLPLRLIYGSYPDVVCHPGSEKEILNNLTESYLYKDILIWERIKRPDKIVRLLQALAYQVGSEVSTNELSQMVELDRSTVDKYINLLEEAQVIFRLGTYSRNLRTEIKSGRKIYFNDNISPTSTAAPTWAPCGRTTWSANCAKRMLIPSAMLCLTFGAQLNSKKSITLKTVMANLQHTNSSGTPPKKRKSASHFYQPTQTQKFTLSIERTTWTICPPLPTTSS